MSIPILYDLHGEVRRLFIAGSTLAAGDGRLSKLLPQLQKMGESAPVFAKLADGVKQTVEADPEQAAEKLLALGTLLHSILYTQGRSEPEGQPEPLETANVSGETFAPFRKLKPLLEALTTKGSGRIEIIREAHEEKLFADIRTILPAIGALDDSYSEIADFMADTVIPSMGAAPLPLLKRQFRPDGGKSDARRLQLIRRIAGEAEKPLYRAAAADGGLEVRAAAIELLGEYPEFEPFLLEQADDRRKEIRRASLGALARLGTEPAVDRLMRAVTDKDRDLAIEPIRLCSAPLLTERLLQLAGQLLEKLQQPESKEDAAETIAVLHAVVQGFEEKREQGVMSFLQRLLSDKAFMSRETGAIQDTAAQLLLDMGQPVAYEFLVSLGQSWKRRLIAYGFRAAVRTLPPGDVYDRFAQDFREKKTSAAGKELYRTMHAMTNKLANAADEAGRREALKVWDSRWVQLFAELDEEELVWRMAERPDKPIVDYIVFKLDNAPNFNQSRTVQLLHALFRLGFRDAPERVMQVLELKNIRQMYYLGRDQAALLLRLPRSYADRLEQAASGFAYEGVKQQVLEAAEYVRNKQDEPTGVDAGKGAGWIEWIKSKMF